MGNEKRSKIKTIKLNSKTKRTIKALSKENSNSSIFGTLIVVIVENLNQRGMN